MTTIVTQLPLSSDPAYRYAIALEGQARLLYFYWNARSMSWQLDIRNVDETPIILGVKLVANYPMLADYSLEGMNWRGILLLIPDNSEQVSRLSDEPGTMAQFYKLYHSYVKD